VLQRAPQRLRSFSILHTALARFLTDSCSPLFARSHRRSSVKMGKEKNHINLVVIGHVGE
jgi:hypothetical protein